MMILEIVSENQWKTGPAVAGAHRGFKHNVFDIDRVRVGCEVVFAVFTFAQETDFSDYLKIELKSD